MIKLFKIAILSTVVMSVSCTKDVEITEADLVEKEVATSQAKGSSALAGAEFITTWEGKEITIPTDSDYTYNYNIDWDNDGIVDQTGVTGNVTHTFNTPGKHTIRISGVFPAIIFLYSDQENNDKIVSVDQWGTIKWLSMRYAFYSCINLEFPAKDAPDLSRVTNMGNMFDRATMANPDVSKWDVSNVTNMEWMFYRAVSANPDVSKWDVSNVIDMWGFFSGAKSANPDVSNWDVSNVVEMNGVFSGLVLANPDVSKWDVSKVTNMSAMFSGTELANPDVSNWNVSNVKYMGFMFIGAKSANPDVSKWDVSNVIRMEYMFSGAKSANPDVSNWNVSNVTNMRNMFENSKLANPDVSHWNIGKVSTMENMFTRAASFTNENYDKLLINFANQPHKNNVKLDAETEAISTKGLAARQALINDGWVINDRPTLE